MGSVLCTNPTILLFRPDRWTNRNTLGGSQGFLYERVGEAGTSECDFVI